MLLKPDGRTVLETEGGDKTLIDKKLVKVRSGDKDGKDDRGNGIVDDSAQRFLMRQSRSFGEIPVSLLLTVWSIPWCKTAGNITSTAELEIDLALLFASPLSTLANPALSSCHSSESISLDSSNTKSLPTYVPQSSVCAGCRPRSLQKKMGDHVLFFYGTLTQFNVFRNNIISLRSPITLPSNLPFSPT